MKKFHGHSHGLKLTVADESGDQICSVCKLHLSSTTYACTEQGCNFILHESCSELPEKFHHKSNPNHTFTLISSPPEHILNCNACGDLIDAFAFQCDDCDRRMHVKCAFMPETVECKAHKHELELYFSASKGNVDGCTFFMCDVCEGGVTEGCWSYYCKECDFGTHLKCAASAEAPVAAEEGGEENDDEKQLERMRIVGKIELI